MSKLPYHDPMKLRVFDPDRNVRGQAVMIDLQKQIVAYDHEGQLWFADLAAVILERCVGRVDRNGVDIYENDYLWTDHNFGAEFGKTLHTGKIVFSSHGSFMLRSGAIAVSLASLSLHHWKLEVQNEKYRVKGLPG